MKIAYKRCSTSEGKQSVDRQLFSLSFDKVYVEYASGKDEDNRPIFTQMIRTLKKGDELHFQDLSRCGRNTKQLLNTVEYLLEKEIKVVFHTESLTFVSDEVDPMAGAISKMLLTMLASVNELFLTQNKVAIKQGLAKVKATNPEKLAKGIGSKWRKSYDSNKSNHKTTRNTTNVKSKMLPVKVMIEDIIDFSKDSVTLKGIASTLNNKGLTTARGGIWSESNVSNFIKRNNISYSKKTNKTRN